MPVLGRRILLIAVTYQGKSSVVGEASNSNNSILLQSVEEAVIFIYCSCEQLITIPPAAVVSSSIYMLGVCVVGVPLVLCRILLCWVDFN